MGLVRARARAGVRVRARVRVTARVRVRVRVRNGVRVRVRVRDWVRAACAAALRVKGPRSWASPPGASAHAPEASSRPAWSK